MDGTPSTINRNTHMSRKVRTNSICALERPSLRDCHLVMVPSMRAQQPFSIKEPLHGPLKVLRRPWIRIADETPCLLVEGLNVRITIPMPFKVRGAWLAGVLHDCIPLT